jgi:hypothetical protein
MRDRRGPGISGRRASAFGPDPEDRSDHRLGFRRARVPGHLLRPRRRALSCAGRVPTRPPSAPGRASSSTADGSEDGAVERARRPCAALAGPRKRRGSTSRRRPRDGASATPASARRRRRRGGTACSRILPRRAAARRMGPQPAAPVRTRPPRPPRLRRGRARARRRRHDILAGPAPCRALQARRTAPAPGPTQDAGPLRLRDPVGAHAGAPRAYPSRRRFGQSRTACAATRAQAAVAATGGERPRPGLGAGFSGR